MAYRAFISGSLLVLTFGLGVHAISQQGEEKAPPKADLERVQKLIEQLGDDQFARREKAAQELEAIGPAALDLLRQAIKSEDQEVSRRAAGLVSRIEEKLLTAAMLAPRRLRLNVKDVSVEEAIAELAKKSGYPIQLAGDKPANRKITLDTGEVTFWEALEQLCRKAELVESLPPPGKLAQANPAPGGGPVVVKIPIQAGIKGPAALPGIPPGQAPAQPASTIVLTDGKPRELVTVLAGTVRIRVLPRVEGAAPPAGETELWLDVTAEPRLQDFGVIGAPRIDKVVDDQGQSLAMALAPAEPPKENGNNFMVNGNAILIVNGKVLGPGGAPVGEFPKQRQVPVRLKLGEKAAKTLKELSGSLAVQALKETEPLATVDNILKAAGQTVKGADGSVLQVQAVEKLADGGVKIQVVLENPPGQNPLGNNPILGNIKVNGMPLGANQASPPNYPKLIDAQGKAHAPAEVVNPKPDFNTGKIEATLIYRPQGEPGQLVLYGQRTATISVPFTLKNVPLP